MRPGARVLPGARRHLSPPAGSGGPGEGEGGSERSPCPGRASLRLRAQSRAGSRRRAAVSQEGWRTLSRPPCLRKSDLKALLDFPPGA